MRKIIATIVAVAGLLALSGCAAWSNSHNYNAPPPAHIITGTWTRVESPGNYPSIIMECLRGDGIWELQDSTNVQVIPHDPVCTPTAALNTYAPGRR